jgi:hypothetical protein
MHMVDERESKGGNEAEDEDGDWEFVPLLVPEGISLRNFGIQVVSVHFAFHPSKKITIWLFAGHPRHSLRYRHLLSYFYRGSQIT